MNTRFQPLVRPALAALLICSAVGAQPSPAQVADGGLGNTPPCGKPACHRKIDLGDFGGMVMRFGDLNGDEQADVVVVQSRGQNITCITALDLDGKRLWQRGKASEKNRALTSDVAVQIYDWDNDGRNEVLVIEGKTFRILDGGTGNVKKEQAVPSNDSILIGNFTGASRPNDLMIKDRYKNIWIYDKNLTLLWNKTVNTGHFPMNVDVDGDGRDELLCGYTLFGPDGTVRWDHSKELPDHNDAVDADDMDGDGKIEFAIACSRDAALISAEGKILWRKPLGHAQHAVIGAFVPGRPGKQAVFVDRAPPRGSSGPDRDGGTVYCYDKAGNELWRTAPQGWLTMASTVDGWTGTGDQSFVLLYRRKYGPPVLLDGNGQVAAEFPFPPAFEESKSQYGQYYAQHFDALGDSREEVFVYNAEALWIYHNSAAAPADLPKPDRRANPRIYNASFYVGWQ